MIENTRSLFQRTDMIKTNKEVNLVDVFNLIGKVKNFTFKGHKVNLTSITLKIIKRRPYCTYCGCFASKAYICLDGAMGNPFIGIYCLRGGREVLLTKDHIIAIADGGSKYGMKNLQTLCYDCNSAKGSKKGGTRTER